MDLVGADILELAQHVDRIGDPLTGPVSVRKMPAIHGACRPTDAHAREGWLAFDQPHRGVRGEESVYGGCRAERDVERTR
jgi:hypothetical protein